MIKNTVKEATIIVLVSIALSLAVYSLRPGKIGLTRPGPTTGQETDNKDYKVITIDQAITDGKVKIDGDAAKFGEFLSMLDSFEFWFDIVTP